MPEFTEEFVLQLARDAYRNGTASFEISAAACALLVIDMQEEFVKPGWSPSWVPGPSWLRHQRVWGHG